MVHTFENCVPLTYIVYEFFNHPIRSISWKILSRLWFKHHKVNTSIFLSRPLSFVDQIYVYNFTCRVLLKNADYLHLRLRDVLAWMKPCIFPIPKLHLHIGCTCCFGFYLHTLIRVLFLSCNEIESSFYMYI